MLIPDLHIIQIAFIIFLMVLFFIFEVLSIEVTALVGISLLVLCNILTIDEAISGFGSPAVIVIVAIFIISRSLVKTGFLEVVTDYFYKIAGNSKWWSLSLFYFMVAVISGFINNTAAVSIFIPLGMNLSHRFHISPTKVLLPLSYAAIFGGTLTLIGTSTNILVNNYISTNPNVDVQLHMFDFVKIGSIFLVIGTIYNLFISRFLLPSRAITSSLTQKYHMRTFLTEYKVTKDSKILNSSFKSFQIKRDFNIQLLKIIRDDSEIVENLRNTILKEDDIIIVQVNASDIMKIRDSLNLLLLSDIKINQDELSGKNYVIVEGLIPQYSSLVNQSISKIDFRRRFGAFVLAIQRQTELLRNKVAHVMLKFSDTLLIMVPKKKLQQLQDERDLIILEEMDIHLKYESYWWLSIILLPFIMAVSYINPDYFIPAALFGAVLLLVLRSISIESAYEAINWQVIVMIALLIPLGAAMEKEFVMVDDSVYSIAQGQEYGYIDYDGPKMILNEGVKKLDSAATVMSNEIIDFIDYYGHKPQFVVIVLYLITFVASAFMSNAAVAIILAPLAVNLGQSFDGGVDPTKAFLMAICFGASASFMTPIGYQTNLMVFGPGQYKFKDFLIAGIPITLIFWAVASYFIPYFYL